MKTKTDTQQQEPIIINEEQADALARLLARWDQLPDHIDIASFYDDALMVVIGGMTIGIEEDGYTHS